MKRHARTAILALAAAVAGFALTRLDPPPTSPAPESATDPAPSEVSRVPAKRSGPPLRERFVSPHGTLAEAALDPDPVQRRLSVMGLSTDVDAGELADSFAHHRMNPELAPLIAATWARVDPEGMFAFLRDNDDARNAPGLRPMRILFENWLRAEPEAALAAIEDEKLPRQHRRTARGAYVNSLLNADPDKAFAYLATLPIPELPQQPDWRKNQWIASDPDRAVERVTALPDSPFRDAALEQIAATWFDLDPAGAATWLATTTAQNQWQPTSALLEEWVEGDPAGAAQYVAENIVGDQRSNSVQLIAARWARDDPQAALDWVTENIWGGPRHRALSYIALETTKQDPNAALALLEQIPDPSTRDSARKKVAQEWQRQDSDAALAWAHGLSDPQAREDALVAMAHSWSNRSARGAGAHALEQLAVNPDSIPIEYTQVVAKRWVERLPAESFNWISKLPPDHAAAAFQLATDTWGKASRAPVTKKVLHQSLPEQRDLALRALLNTYLKYDGIDTTRAFVEGVQSVEDRDRLRGYLTEHERATAENP